MAHITNSPANNTNENFIHLAHRHLQPKDMSDREAIVHQSARDHFREFIEETGAASIKAATIEQLKEAITKVVAFTKNGTLGETSKVCISDRVVIIASSLRAELNRVAQAEEITIGRAIEKYIVDGFDFEANTGKKATGKAPVKNADTKPKESAAVPTTAQPIDGKLERTDLIDQLLFHGADSTERVSELLEAWNLGGEFYLKSKRTGELGKKVKALDEQADRQTLIVMDDNGKKIGMCYMDKITQYFTVVETIA